MSRPLLCERGQSQLLVIDIQTRLAAAMEEEDRARVLRNGAALAEAAQRFEVPRLVSEQYPKGLGPTEPELAERLGPEPATVEKTCFACSASPAFRDSLDRLRRQVVLCGMESHVCVLQSALELLADGYAVFVVEDAVCSRSAANHQNAMDRLRQAGVVVTNTESVLFEWLRDARHEQFKAVSALIK